MVQTIRKPKGLSVARALDTNWMGVKPPYLANSQNPPLCAGPRRFAQDFRDLRSPGNPSDMGKRTAQENIVARRTALPTMPVV